MRELNNVAALSAALEDARGSMLSLYAHLSPAQLQVPYLKTINPPLWEMAHVGWFQEYWCLRYRKDRVALASRLRDADTMLNSAIIPHLERWKLHQLTAKSVADYLRSELDDTLNTLEKSTALPLYFFQLALYHEDMHAEAMLMTLQTLGAPAPQRLRGPLPRPAPAQARGEVEFEGGELEMGSQPGPDFAFDNEMPARLVHVAPFRLASTVATNADYLMFVEAGGYQRRELWSQTGWEWRKAAAALAPGYWRKSDGVWLARRFDGWEQPAAEDPIIHVNAYEAEAYCRFIGRRLPTEAEWEFAARADHPAPADRFPWGPTLPPPGVVNLDGAFAGTVPAAALPGSDTRRGLRQMIGNAWEWTSTAFAPYPGFEPGPYQEYSEPWFHTHRVLRGGSFATRARLVHSRWRNFYTPERRDIFAGIRPAGSL